MDRLEGAPEGVLAECKLVCRKTQEAIRKNADYFLQMHVGQSVNTSIALGVLTNSTYSQCDLWRAITSLTHLCGSLQTKLQVQEQKVRQLWPVFLHLQETDFHTKVEKHKARPAAARDWYDQVMAEINAEVDGVVSFAKQELDKETDARDLSYLVLSLILDAALIRQILYKEQQVLFDGTKTAPPDKPGFLAGYVGRLFK